jgi:hypothetical protein
LDDAMKEFVKNIIFWIIYIAIVLGILAILKELTCQPFSYEPSK